MEVFSPDFEIPDGGEIIWSWYFQASDGLRRVDDGVCFPIPWDQFLSWSSVTGTIVRSDEYIILRAMDTAFCDEMNKELQAYQERIKQAQQNEIDAARRNAR